VVVHALESFTADEVVRVVEGYRITLLSLVPTMLKRLFERQPAWTPPAHLRAILLGGAAVPPALAEEAARRAWPVLKTYGLTEACSQVATWPYGEPLATAGGCPPLPGIEVRVRDGIIELYGPQLMTRYLPETDESPFTADGWLRTGDLGHLDEDGRLQVLGRRDEVIVTGGENVAPGEIERVLEEHPGIAEAMAFGIPDEEWGEALAVALVASGDEPVDSDLRRHVGERLARYKMPRWVAYLQELSRLPSGKRDRSATATRARGGLRRL
jgi:O-succinylbenzoic acid--CoA ligase